ncbi:hypothetical protein [Xenorhabdus griffiniae]|uniref:Uncharacterized protein n=1 Tax=Xenorhabdus griffiniae TaxID=351672 RepID=A0ABY9XKY0_9GAMM|nr:hypothetical protein [Xenorhabdus griffiniae]MBD1229383.1 hypothetical protein [Xenorhabdus griffiniae]MBE8589074.1 hypothetical protein [Xenorhabdus griffiniae]WMV73433.1 hypothetical protein QL128_05220 [Xenorhabdus griffiniae]WNH03112.1 hypothetical protein QL112_005225 [Xenorhabdus griffiniae]
MQVQALGGNKKILSINIIFPKGFTQKEEYIDSTELFYPSQNMNVLIEKIFPKNMAEGEYSVAIPVRFVTRYAAEGDAYIDNSIYMMNFYINVKGENSKRRISINDIQITYASRTPMNLLYYAHLLTFGEIDENNIDKMFEEKQYKKTIKFVGSI